MRCIAPLTRRQAQLADKMLELMLAEGFSRLTIDNLTDRLGCSKRTLYALADSKEQLATRSVSRFFKQATDQVEASICRTRSPAQRLTGYLEAVARALEPASRDFMADVAAFTPAREVYELNTQLATRRVRELIVQGTGAGAFRKVPPDFVAEVVSSTMRRIATGEMQSATGLTDAEAYHQLAKLVLAAVRR
ncbi:MAG: TetR/AcrR family transcriptional regulator [Propionibacteriaceae bacterium]